MIQSPSAFFLNDSEETKAERRIRRYRQAMEAEEDFTSALVMQFGPTNADYFRFDVSKHHFWNTATRNAHSDKVEADADLFRQAKRDTHR